MFTVPRFQNESVRKKPAFWRNENPEPSENEGFRFFVLLFEFDGSDRIFADKTP